MRVLMMGVVCALSGCAKGPPAVSTVEFTAEDERVFDNSVDLVDKPAIVESEWRGGFERRVTRADVIAAVKVEALSADEDRRGAGYRLTVRVVDRLKGRSARELVLRVQDDELGFRTVRANEDRLLRDPFIVFIKWQSDPEFDGPVARWHLSPDSPEVRDKVAFFLNPPSRDDRTQVEALGP